MAAQTFRPDRSLANLSFASWRLGSGSFVKEQHSLALPGAVYSAAAEAPDLLHTRAAVLRNHLHRTQQATFVCLAAGTSSTSCAVHEVVLTSDGVPSLRAVADLPIVQAPAGAAGQAAEAALDCSVALAAPPAAAATSSAAGAAGGPAPPPWRLLASCGQGDLRLVTLDEAGTAAHVSDAIFPLRPAPPLAGVRPFVLESAYATPTGELRALAWAAAAPAAGQQPGPAGGSVWRAELWALTLAWDLQEGSSQGALRVVAASLLQKSGLPPHAVAPLPAADAFLVAAGQLDEEAEAEALLAGAGTGGAGPMAIGNGGEGAGDEEEGGDVSPRTLEQAAARLAKYTGEQLSGPLPEQRWADVYHEAGPDGLGGMGQEPSLTLALFQAGGASGGGDDEAVGGTLSPPLASSSEAALLQPPASSQVQGSGVPAAATTWNLAWSMAGGAHQVLAAQGGGAGGGGLLLGLSDDVDCDVVAVGMAAGSPAPRVDQQGSIPALAYVVAGKTQRRHLLLGPQGSPVAAVLVEGQRYLYLYGALPGPTAQHGTQEVVDMQLAPGASVLGACLLGSPSDGELTLLLLTRHELRAYRLSAAA